MTSETSPAVHPDDVFKALLEKTSRPQRARNLELFHRICGAQFRGSKDFSIASIGRLCEAAGGLKARAIYNAASFDYRTLVHAWEAFAGSSRHPPQSESRWDALLMRIPDPAVRTLIQGRMIERDKFRAELNLLKSKVMLRIEVGCAGVVSEGLSAGSSAPVALTVTEREALEQAVSPSFLAAEGWSEGANGDILNNRGRRLFAVGFSAAIRKMLSIDN